MEERNCAFQYAKIENDYFKSIKMVVDENELTLSEAKELWNNHYEDAAKYIKAGNSVEMAIWVNMISPGHFNETLQYISTDAESDGLNIWEVKRNYFKKY